jgi:hypothetical protein
VFIFSSSSPSLCTKSCLGLDFLDFLDFLDCLDCLDFLDFLDFLYDRMGRSGCCSPAKWH